MKVFINFTVLIFLGFGWMWIFFCSSCFLKSCEMDFCGMQIVLRVERLEMGALPITHGIRVRRLLYLQIILKRHKDELIMRVYSSQKENPVAGYWS